MILIRLFLCFLTPAFAGSFDDAIQFIEKHETVLLLREKAKSVLSQGHIDGSWGDPVFGVMAKNYPRSLDGGISMMTGIDFSIGQKIALTNRYGNIKKSQIYESNAIKYEALDQKQVLIKTLWETLIIKKQIEDEIKIFKENLIWITKMLAISNKLYANGTISSQAILDIQIRKSEIETLINNKEFEISKIADKLVYLTGSDTVQEDTIPWEILDKPDNSDGNDDGNDDKKNNEDDEEYKLDHKSKSYLSKRASRNLSLKATKKGYLPDLNVSVVYTKRRDEDFVGLSAGIALPFTNHRKVGKALSEKALLERQYRDYKNKRKLKTELNQKELSKIKKELSILSDKTIKFATDLRNITAKSYSLGNSSYTELLQSELKLQQILLKQIMLEAKAKQTKVELRYLGAYDV